MRKTVREIETERHIKISVCERETIFIPEERERE